MTERAGKVSIEVIGVTVKGVIRTMSPPPPPSSSSGMSSMSPASANAEKPVAVGFLKGVSSSSAPFKACMLGATSSPALSL